MQRYLALLDELHTISMSLWTRILRCLFFVLLQNGEVCSVNDSVCSPDTHSHLESGQYFYEDHVLGSRVTIEGVFAALSSIFRTLPDGGLSPKLSQLVSASCGYTHGDASQCVSETTTIIQSGEAPFFTGEEPPPTLGELKHALSPVGGSQLSRLMSSGRTPHLHRAPTF